jgi:hypothetical protein
MYKRNGQTVVLSDFIPAIAFRSEAKARRFDHYLKTGSGREFDRRHF